MKSKPFQEQFTSFRQKAQNWFTTSNKSVQGNNLEVWFFALGALALASLILGIISFSRPASRVVKDDVRFEHVGFFTYSAPAPQGVYDSNVIKNGDPIFPKLTCTVDVSFQYTFIGQEAANIAGTYQLTATIAETVSGWQRSVPLQEETKFTGNVFGTATRLNLCQMEKLAQSMEEGVDFHPGLYTLTISPNIKVTGNVSGRALGDSFSPSLSFIYDRIHFYLVHGEDQGDVFNPTKTGTISEEHRIANSILLFGKELAVPALRWFAVIGLAASLAGIAFIGMKLQELSQSDQNLFIRTRYDSMLIDVHLTAPIEKTGIIVDVTSIEDLAKLAEKYNAMILHTENGSLHEYSVRDEETTYRFVVPVEMGPTVPEKEAQP